MALVVLTVVFSPSWKYQVRLYPQKLKNLFMQG